MSADSDKQKILAAMGGKKGLFDSGIPALIFLVTFNVSKDLKISSFLALGFAIVISGIRLIRKETLQHSVSGVIGVGICAWLSNRSGNAIDFFKLGIWTNLIYAIVYILSILIKWPVIGLFIGPLLGEDFRWRLDPSRRRIYARATWLWVGLFLFRLAVQYPMYRNGNTNEIGIARLVMGYPLFILTAWLTWLIIKNGPKLQENLRPS